jgi:phage shock protein C
MAQTRKLDRSRTDRKLAGVCGGLAQYFNADATLIRVLFVVLMSFADLSDGLRNWFAGWLVVTFGGELGRLATWGLGGPRLAGFKLGRRAGWSSCEPAGSRAPAEWLGAARVPLMV